MPVAKIALNLRAEKVRMGFRFNSLLRVENFSYLTNLQGSAFRT